MAKYNIVYPCKFGSNNKIIVSDDIHITNPSRIRMILSNMPGNRPYHPIYGSLLGWMEQETISNPGVIEYVMKFGTVINQYAFNYMKLNSIGLETVPNERLAQVNVDYINLQNGQ